jgi:hypothetical protein
MWRLERLTELRAERRPLEGAAIPLWWIKQVALVLIGRPVRCGRCGRVAFAAIPVVRRGRVVLHGVSTDYRVRWAAFDELEVAHLDVDRCGRR